VHIRSDPLRHAAATRRWLPALLVSLALHGGLVSWLNARAPAPAAAASPSGAPPRPPLRVQVLASETPAQPQPAEEPDAAAPTPALRPSAVPQAGTAARPQAGPHFYTIEEVDQPAHPQLDWQLPLERLAAAGLQRLVVRLWILDNGRIQGVDLLDTMPAGLRASEREAIVQGLMQTEAVPALRGTRRVASQRTLEIAIDL
jgi:hypothetical protein